MTEKTRAAIDKFILDALRDQERREVLLELLAQAGFRQEKGQTIPEIPWKDA